jgi:hypothetical protein
MSRRRKLLSQSRHEAHHTSQKESKARGVGLDFLFSLSDSELCSYKYPWLPPAVESEGRHLVTLPSITRPSKEEEARFAATLRNAAPYPITARAMPDWNSETKDRDGHIMEVIGIHMSDEAELARMGYKQELKCVQSIRWAGVG